MDLPLCFFGLTFSLKSEETAVTGGKCEGCFVQCGQETGAQGAKLVNRVGPLLGANKMHATWHLTKLSTAGIMLGAFFRRERKISFCLTYTSVF